MLVRLSGCLLVSLFDVYMLSTIHRKNLVYWRKSNELTNGLPVSQSVDCVHAYVMMFYWWKKKKRVEKMKKRTKKRANVSELNTITWQNANECEKETRSKQSNKWLNEPPPSPPSSPNDWRVFIVFMTKAIATRVICAPYTFRWFYIHFTCAYPLGITQLRVEYQL